MTHAKKILVLDFDTRMDGNYFYSSSTPYEKQDMRPFLGNYIDLSFLEPVLSGISFTYHQSVVSVETLGIAGFIEFLFVRGHILLFSSC